MLHKHALTVYCSETRTHPTRARDWLCVSHTLQASLLELFLGAKLSRRRLEVALLSRCYVANLSVSGQDRIPSESREETQNSHTPQRISPTPQTGCSSVPTNGEVHSILQPQNIHSMGRQPPVRFNETREYYKRAPLNFIPQAVRGPRFHAQPLFKPKGRTR